MLQASSRFSKVCGHSHIKKFWLMQTQNESQANVGCEENGNMATSSCFLASASASVRSSAIKHGSGVADGMRSLMAGGSPSKSSDRIMASGVGTTQDGVGRGSVTGTAKCASLVTCAESLSPPLQENMLRRSSSYTSSGGNADSEDTDGNEDSKADGSDDEGLTVFKSPLRNKSDFSATSSGSGILPFGDSHRAESSLNMTENARTQNIENSRTEVMSKLRPPGAAPYVGGNLDLSGGFKNNAECPPQSRSQVCISISVDSKQSSPSLPKNCALRNETCEDEADCGHFNKPGLSPFKHVGEREVCKANARACGRTLMLSQWDINAGSDVPGDQTNDDTDDGLADEVRAHDLNRWDSSNGRSTLRTCSHCGTTKTPLWRSGPQGPKSLCNACGIRFKKSGRCPSVCEGVDLQGSPPSTPNASKFMPRSLKRKHDSSAFSLSSYFQEDGLEIAAEEQASRQSKRKRCPVPSLTREIYGPQGEDTTGSSGESCLTWTMHSPLSVLPSPWKVSIHNKKDVVESVSLEKHNLSTQIFDKEEEEAAVLLMALSCGVVNA